PEAPGLLDAPTVPAAKPVVVVASLNPTTPKPLVLAVPPATPIDSPVVAPLYARMPAAPGRLVSTCNLFSGVVVPIPTLPEELIWKSLAFPRGLSQTSEAPLSSAICVHVIAFPAVPAGAE